MGKHGATYNVITVGEVETSDVHASVEHLHEHISVPAGRSEGADDLGLALAKVDLLEDVLEADSAGIGASVCLYHSILTCALKCVLVSVCVLGLVVPRNSFN